MEERKRFLVCFSILFVVGASLFEERLDIREELFSKNRLLGPKPHVVLPHIRFLLFANKKPILIIVFSR